MQNESSRYTVYRMRFVETVVHIAGERMQCVVDRLHSRSFLQKVYGEDVDVEEWDSHTPHGFARDSHFFTGHKRIVRFRKPIHRDIPTVLKPFVHGDSINVRVAQSVVERSDVRCEVNNKMHFDVFGSHLLSMESTLVARPTSNHGTSLNMSVRMNVRAPPLVKGTIERFLEKEAKKDLTKFETALRRTSTTTSSPGRHAVSTSAPGS